MVRAYTYKLLRSPLMYISIIGISVLCFSIFYDSVRFGYDSVSYHMEIFFGLAQYRNCLIIFGALPFAANFANEWKSGISKECIIRCGVKKYAVCNLLFCWFSSVVVVFLGMWLFMFIDSLFVSWSYVSPNPYFFIFEDYLYNGQGEIYLFFTSVVFASHCAAWSVAGMLLSVIFTDKYVAVCAPLIIWFFVQRFTRMLPIWIDLYSLSLSYFPFDCFNNDFLGFLYCMGVFIIIAAVCGTAFYFLLKRKVQNGIA